LHNLKLSIAYDQLLQVSNKKLVIQMGLHYTVRFISYMYFVRGL